MSLERTREALKSPYTSANQNLHALAMTELAKAEAVIQAARHYVNGTDPDGLLNLISALRALDGKDA